MFLSFFNNTFWTTRCRRGSPQRFPEWTSSGGFRVRHLHRIPSGRDLDKVICQKTFTSPWRPVQWLRWGFPLPSSWERCRRTALQVVLQLRWEAQVRYENLWSIISGSALALKLGKILWAIRIAPDPTEIFPIFFDQQNRLSDGEQRVD